jgi:hypothetical protein
MQKLIAVAETFAKTIIWLYCAKQLGPQQMKQLGSQQLKNFAFGSKTRTM